MTIILIILLTRLVILLNIIVRRVVIIPIRIVVILSLLLLLLSICVILGIIGMNSWFLVLILWFYGSILWRGSKEKAPVGYLGDDQIIEYHYYYINGAPQRGREAERLEQRSVSIIFIINIHGCANLPEAMPTRTL